VTFQVKILGANGAMPAYGRNHSAQLLTLHTHTFLIDCGEGTQLQLNRFNCKPQKISHLFISHLHGDHYFGLMGLLSSMHLQKRTTPLHLFGPQGLREIIALQLRYSESVLNYPLIFHETQPHHPQHLLDTKSVEVFSFPLKHRIPCTGFLFREKPLPLKLKKSKLPENLPLQAIALLKQGMDVKDEDGKVRYAVADYTLPPPPPRSYAYCSDTLPSNEVAEYVHGVNLLYHEATFLTEKEDMAQRTYHTTAAQAAQLAKRAQVGHLLLGHFSARYKELDGFLEESIPHFEHVSLAEEGLTYSIDG
jgi:ribonuclease Z